MSLKRKAYTVAEKLKAVDRVKKGEAKTKVGRDIGAPESTVRRWVREEDKLRQFIDNIEHDEGLARKKARTAKDSDLDQAVYTWFVQRRHEGVPISGPLLRAQAEKFNREINGDPTFTATDGWLMRFKKRHAISQLTVCGEAKSADSEAADAYSDELRTLIAKYELCDDQVYNCDETAMFYKMLPEKTLAEKKDKRSTEGYKRIKDRLTLLLCVNKTGSHKLTPLVIGKYQRPRCFHHVDMTNLPLLYRHSGNAWMTRQLFEDWFHKDFVPAVQAHQRENGLARKALLLMDHCPVHPPAESLVSRDGKITTSFLPKNTTSKIQPLDQGVIMNFKANYRKNLLREILESDLVIPQFLKALNIKDMLYIAAELWAAVTPTAIANCWRKGLGKAFDDDDEVDDFEGFTNDEVQRSAAQLQARGYEIDSSVDNINLYATIEEDVPTSEVVSDADIISSISQPQEQVDESDSETELEENDDGIMTAHQANEAARGVLRFLERQSGQSVSQLELFNCRNVVKVTSRLMASKSKQSRLTDFFCDEGSR